MTVKDAAATKKPKSTQPQTKSKNRDLLNIEEELSEAFGHKIQIEQKSSSKGRLFIFYASKDDREAIISKLLKLKNN